MAEVLNFPGRTVNSHGMERYLMAKECLVLGSDDPFEGWIKILNEWLAAHPQAHSQRNDALRALLADTWLVFHIACDEHSRLKMQPYHSRRWSQLQYSDLSDFELLVIVNDNLIDLRRGLNELCQQARSRQYFEENLCSLRQDIDRLNQQLNHFLEFDGCVDRQPEWTS